MYRALSKHCHRAENDSNKYWGDANGSEETKNNKAYSILQDMLSNCVWINCHVMSGQSEDTPILELRLNNGYGMRWLLKLPSNNSSSNSSNNSGYNKVKSEFIIKSDEKYSKSTNRNIIDDLSFDSSNAGNEAFDSTGDEKVECLDENSEAIAVSFRGFLEPNMVNGHEVGWKH
jgi:hypothetical protein